MGRFTAGLDWLLGDRCSAYLRYVYDDYVDETAAYNSGLAHLFLAGFTVIH